MADIPREFVNVLAEMVFSALIRDMEPDEADLLVLYSWLASGEGDQEMVIETLAKLEEAGYWT